MNQTTTGRQAVTLHPSGTRHLSDAEFLDAFESCALAGDAFRHYDHIRLAWMYLRAFPLDEATARMGSAIRRFALHHTGATTKYDDTLTRAWMLLVAHARTMSADAADFTTFAEAHPMLFDRRQAFAFYGLRAP